MVDTDFTKRMFVCQGTRIGGDGKPYIILKELDKDGVRMHDVKKSTKHFNVGSVYEMEASDDSIRPSTSKYHDLWTDKAERAQWAALTNAAKAQLVAEKQEDADKKKLYELLDPLRAMYWETNARGQAAIEISVLHYLRRGKP